MTLSTIALELVPPNVDRGREQALEEAQKVLRCASAVGLEGRIRHVMIPGMIEEDDDRPIEMKPKMDVLDFWSIIKPELPGVNGLCTQVTAFLDESALRQRLTDLRDAGIDGIAFVGVPRTMNDGEGSGVAPTDALSIFDHVVPNRGVILIPTREGEHGRFNFKCDQGATYGMTQLLYSDAIVDFLTGVRRDDGPPARDPAVVRLRADGRDQRRPDQLADPGSGQRRRRRRTGLRQAPWPKPNPADTRKLMVDLYKRVIDGVGDLGFPLSIHFEATYGVNKPAFDTFAEMLAYWSPDTH